MTETGHQDNTDESRVLYSRTLRLRKRRGSAMIDNHFGVISAADSSGGGKGYRQ